MKQMDLFKVIKDAYSSAPDGRLSNAQLYEQVISATGQSPASFHQKSPVGVAGAMHSTNKRKIRWYQQTLKSMGAITNVEGERGVWQLAEPQGKELHRAIDGVKLVAFSTDLGIAIWGSNVQICSNLCEPIALCITSPPYPLRVARKYGNPDVRQYVEFILRALEPVVRTLLPGGSIVLNLSNDIFEPGSPARSMYLERLGLAIHDELGLHLMDRIPWVNKSKPPGPTWWACVNEVQLSATYEHILWFTNDPQCVRSNNRRVLEPHTDAHKQLMAKGGAGRTAVYGDGSYRLRDHSFGVTTKGRLPRNIIERGHRCADTQAVRAAAKQLGLPPHGAMFPTSIPDFFIELLTEPGELVVDIFSGSGKTGLSAQRLGRRWMLCECVLEFIRVSSELFRSCNEFWLNPALLSVGNVRA